MTKPSRSGVRILPVTQWPRADAMAWEAACQPQPGPFGRRRQLSPYTYRKYAAGYGAYLWHLQTEGLLDPGEKITDLVALSRLGSFYAWLVECGNGDLTIVGRFEELRGALQIIHPDCDFSFITRPNNISLRQMLPMARRVLFTPDSRHAELWAEALFAEALTLANPARRRVQVRDATLLGIVASRGLRLRSLEGLRLGQHVVRTDQTWLLVIDETLLKGGRSRLELPLSPRIGALLERYLTVERQELLDGGTHDYLWVSLHGEPLGRKGVDYMVRTRTKAHYGTSFGTHRFRTSLTTTQAIVDGTNGLGPSRILGHTPAIGLKNYNRANNLEATRRHDQRINEAEDAARRMLGVEQDRPPARPLPSLGQVEQKRQRKPNRQLNLFDAASEREGWSGRAKGVGQARSG